MLLNQMMANLRIELQDTEAESNVWSEDSLKRAIEKSVGLMSRLLPKRSMVESTIVRTVTGETLTIASDTGTLANTPIKPGSLVITGKTLDTDYRVNYLTGVVTEIDSLLTDGDYTASYELDPRMYKLSSILTKYMKIERIEYPVGNGTPTLVTADVFGDFLVFRGDVILLEDTHLRIVYLGEWDVPTITTNGDYPSNLDDVVIIGSVGQALIFKAETYTQLAVSTTADILVAIATLDTLSLSDPGLTAPTTPSLTELTTPTVPELGTVIAPILHVFANPTPPSLPSGGDIPTAPTAPTLGELSAPTLHEFTNPLPPELPSGEDIPTAPTTPELGDPVAPILHVFSSPSAPSMPTGEDVPTAPTAPELADPTAPTLASFSAPSAPSMPTGADIPTAPTAPTLSYSDTDTALGLITTEITAAKAHHTTGAALANASTRGESPAKVYGDYADALVRASEARAQEALITIRQQEDDISLHAAEVTSYGSAVNRYANQISGLMALYREEINSQEAAAAFNVAMNGKYEGEIREVLMAATLYEAEVRQYQAEVSAYVAEITGSIAIYREEIEDEKAAVAFNGTMIATYEAEIKEVLLSISLYEAEIRQYQVEVNAYAAVISGTIALYSETIEGEQAAIASNGVLVAKYEAEIRDELMAVSRYEGEVRQYQVEVTAYTGVISGTINLYLGKIEGEKTAVASNGAMIAKYEAEIREELMAVSLFEIEVSNFQAEISEVSLLIAKFEAEVRNYQTEVAESQADIAVYEAKVNNITQGVTQAAVQVRNYLDIAGRYLASGQAKINEMLLGLGVKMEFPVQKASSEQR